MTLASYKPEHIYHLYVAMSCLDRMILVAPQFIRLQRLEIYDDRGFLRNESLYDFFTELQTMHRGPSTSQQCALSELALVMPEWQAPVDDYAKPLVLTHWNQLRRLDLLTWQAMIDWESLPVANLNDLRLNLATLTKGFNPAAFFGSCGRLRTLFIHNVEHTTFSWIQQQLSDNPMAKLMTLEIGGARQPLTLLALKDKAVFEFNPLAMEHCPLLRHLTLGIDADKTGPGCTELMSPRFGKWYELHDTMKLVGQYGRQLESMRFEGTWIFGGRLSLLATQPMVHLK
ncbi:hypothetical protein EC991_008334, partial [Linnemannia zychae]